MPDPQTFFRDYVCKRKPVIITNLFEGEEIRHIRTKQDARAQFDLVNLRVRPEYTSDSEQGDANVRPMTFGEYWDYIERDPSSNLMCTEHEIPAKLMALYRMPEVCRARRVDGPEILSLPPKYGDYDLLTNLFIANRGNKAHLHYDGDHRHVLLYQVFGRKEVILFEPHSGLHLEPLNSLVFSGISLQAMSDTQKDEFVHRANGWRDVLLPGETVYMPMLCWHYLEYLDDAMSFNIRFGRNKYGRFMCVDHFHRDYYLQNVAALFGDMAACETKYSAYIDRIIAEFSRADTSQEQKALAMRQLFKDIYAELASPEEAEAYCPPEREVGEREKILGFVRNTLRYAPPAVIAATRSTGAISPEQIYHVRQRAQRCGYSSELLSRLLLNRIGKAELEQASRAEAAQFVAFLKMSGNIS